jgi:hypothetical protein
MSRSRRTPRGGLGPRGRYWLEDEGWERYQTLENPPPRLHPRISVTHAIGQRADRVPRRDAVALVRAWQLIVDGPIEDPIVDDAGEPFAYAIEIAEYHWFPREEIFTSLFGVDWPHILRSTQRKEVTREIEREILAWLKSDVVGKHNDLCGLPD